MSTPDKVTQAALAEDALTARIKAKYREVETLAQSTVMAGIELGGMLTEKKKSLPHGAWGGWLKEHFDGSERHAQRFMKLYSEREELLADPTRVSDLSLRGAFKEIVSPKKKELPAPEKEEEKEPTFEDVVALVNNLRAIRDKELYREKNYETFGDYIEKEWWEGTKVLLEGWEPVVDNPPPELRGASPEKAIELTERLKELSRPPEEGSGLVPAGRQLREIEERELYKLIGYPTFTRFCREHLRLSGKYQTQFSLAVDLADIHPFFNFDLNIFESDEDSSPMSEEEWKYVQENLDALYEKAMPLLEEWIALEPEGSE